MPASVKFLKDPDAISASGIFASAGITATISTPRCSASQTIDDLGHIDMLMFQIDGTPRCRDCCTVLVKVRSLALFNVERLAARGCLSVGGTPTWHGSLNLDDGVAPQRRDSCWKRQIGLTANSPSPVLQVTFACLIPSLHKIMVHIHGGRACQFHVGIVVLSLTVMTR